MQFHNDNPLKAEEWLQELERNGLHASSLVVEITEGVLLDDAGNVKERLLASRDAGIQVAIDDFGTGYSSLAYLKKFDIDYLKIDQTFINNLGNHPDDIALCEAIIVMAHKLGLEGHCRRRGDRTAAPAAARRRLRLRAGIPVFEGASGGRIRSFAANRCA